MCASMNSEPNRNRFYCHLNHWIELNSIKSFESIFSFVSIFEWKKSQSYHWISFDFFSDLLFRRRECYLMKFQNEQWREKETKWTSSVWECISREFRLQEKIRFIIRFLRKNSHSSSYFFFRWSLSIHQIFGTMIAMMVVSIYTAHFWFILRWRIMKNKPLSSNRTIIIKIIIIMRWNR